MRNRNPHWIRRTHLFDETDYECSVCRAVFPDTSPSCPACGTSLPWTDDPQDWTDEAEELDMILGDD